MGGSVFTRISGGYPLSSMVLNQISHSPTYDNNQMSQKERWLVGGQGKEGEEP